MDVELPEDIRLLQRTVRGFVDDVLAPYAKEIEDTDDIPRKLIAQMGEAGLFGIGHAEELGGQGFGKLGYCVAVEQLARVNASLWNVVGGSAGLCGTAISVGGPTAAGAISRSLQRAKDRRIRAVRARRRQRCGSLKNGRRHDGDALCDRRREDLITDRATPTFHRLRERRSGQRLEGITAFVGERGEGDSDRSTND